MATQQELNRLWTQKAGSNRALDSLSDHVIEFLLTESAKRDATSFPYFPVANGVLNLITQQLVPEELRPIARMRSAVVFDSKAEAPLFLKTLEDIFEGDQLKISFFIRLAGYMMLGQPKEHIFPVFYGPKGRNGKSLLCEIIRAILGDFACTLPTTAIMTKSHVNDGATPALARLAGKRAVVISEPNRKHQLDSGFIKQLTGGEHISARALFGENIEFLPECVPLMVTNVIPELREDDEALWRRMRILEFNRTFSDDEIDRDLKEKLLQEKSGILNVFLNGVREYLNGGLQTPDSVTASGIMQRKLVDPIEGWHEECALAEAGAQTPLKALWPSYEGWYKENPQTRFMPKREFGKKLEALGYQKIIKSNNPHYVGITLKQCPMDNAA